MSGFHPFEELVDKKNNIQRQLEDERADRIFFKDKVVRLLTNTNNEDLANTVLEFYEEIFK